MELASIKEMDFYYITELTELVLLGGYYHYYAKVCSKQTGSCFHKAFWAGRGQWSRLQAGATWKPPLESPKNALWWNVEHWVLKHCRTHQRVMTHNSGGSGSGDSGSKPSGGGCLIFLQMQKWLQSPMSWTITYGQGTGGSYWLETQKFLWCVWGPIPILHSSTDTAMPTKQNCILPLEGQSLRPPQVWKHLFTCLGASLWLCWC